MSAEPPHDADLDARWQAAWKRRGADANAALTMARSLEVDLEARGHVDAEQRGRLVLLLGSCHWRLGAYGDALRCLTEALELLPDHAAGLRSSALQDLGTIHIYLGQHDEALSHLLAALRIRERLDDEQGRSDIENNLGIVFYQQGDLVEAERSYRSAMERRQRLGDLDGVAACHNNLAKVRTDLGRYAEGMTDLEQARALWSGLDNQRGLAMALTNIGIVHHAQNEFDAAARCYRESLTIKHELADVLGACETATELGRILAKQNRPQDALELLLNAASDAEQLGVSTELADACLALSEVYEAFGDHASALLWFRRYHETERRRFDLRATERLHALQVSFQLERAEREGATDGLTGLTNRRALDRALHEAFVRSREELRHLSIALLDLDDFKQVNDVHGHQVGDEVLRRAAAALRDHTRATDLTARYGGEEFLVAFLDTSLPDAVTAAEQLCERIRTIDWQAVHPELSVTVSIGVADADDVTDVGELLRLADHHLYRAKHLGKDRVHT